MSDARRGANGGSNDLLNVYQRLGKPRCDIYAAVQGQRVHLLRIGLEFACQKKKNVLFANTIIKSRENPTQRVTTIEDTAADTSSKGPLASSKVSEDPTSLCLSSLVYLPACLFLAVLTSSTIDRVLTRTSSRDVSYHAIRSRIASHLISPSHPIQSISSKMSPADEVDEETSSRPPRTNHPSLIRSPFTAQNHDQNHSNPSH